MASAYSTPRDYGKPIPTHNLGLVNTVLATKQGKYDQNIAQIEDTIQQIGNIDLIRDEDKAYLAERVNSLLNVVNANSKLSLSNNNVTRQIKSHISSAIDDNVLKQVSISRQIKSFEQTAAEKKAKNPELYSDANYLYSKDKAGVNSYLNGEVDDIGALQYIDYYDVNESLQKDVESWAKSLGYQKDIDEQGNEFFVRIGSSETLSERKIDDYMNLKIQQDPKLKQQLAINAHHQYRGYSDEELVGNYVQHAEKQYKQVDSYLSDLQAKIRNTNPDNAELLQELQAEENVYLEQRKRLEREKNPANFNRDQKTFEMYRDGLAQQYKNVYAQTNETSVKYQKLASMAVEGANNTNIGGLNGAGTRVSVDGGETKDDDFKMDLTTQEEKLNTELVSFGARLKARNPAKYADMSDEQFQQELKNLFETEDAFNINSQSFDSQTLQEAAVIKELQKDVEETNEQIKNDLQPVIDQFYTGLVGGKSKDLDVENLSRTMPFTAKMIKDGESLQQMSPKEKALVRYEMAQNMGEYLADDEQKPILKRYTQSLVENNNITPEDLQQTRQERPGFWSSLGNTVLSGARKVYNVADYFGGVHTLQTDEQRQQQLDEEELAARESSEEYTRSKADLINATGNLWNQMFAFDDNLSDIDSDDVDLPNYGDKKLLEGALQTAYKNSQQRLEQSAENAPEIQTVTFSPAVKADEPYVASLQSFVEGKGLGVAKGSAFRVFPSTDGRNVSIEFDREVITNDITKGIDRKTTVRAVQEFKIEEIAAKMPELAQTVAKEKAAWSLHRDNPTEFKKEIEFDLPQDAASRREFVDKFIQNNRGFLPQETLQKIQTNPAAYFPTKNEMRQNAMRRLDAQTYQRFEQEVLSPEYSVEFRRITGRGFQPIIKVGGKEVEGYNLETIPTETFNFFTYNQKTTGIIASYIDNKVSDYARGRY